MANSLEFEQSFQYVVKHEDQLMRDYKDKVIAIYLDKVLGVYESKMDAYFRVPKEHGVPAGNFVIKHCTKDDRFYVRVFHSDTDLV